jgi:hypothetical protein
MVGFLRATLLFATLAAPLVPAAAHRQWLLPSATVFSGTSAWLTVDAAVSNGLFQFAHVPLPLDGVAVIATDGTAGTIANAHTGQLRSTFDVKIDRPGTWKIRQSMAAVMGSYKGADGRQHRLPRGLDPAALKAAVPQGATEVRIIEVANRNELFITLGAPTTTALKAEGRGLEMEPVTHPGDLVAGEEAVVRFLIDGKPAPGLAVELVPGGARYRNSPDDATLKTDAEGLVRIRWKAPGLYWLHAEAEDQHTRIPGASTRRLGYSTTLEVLP